MKNNIDINKKINDTFDSAESIGDVKVSPFFKEKVMHHIKNASEDVQEATWVWFTPKVQLATLACVVILNVFAFNNLRESSYEENISSFAESYGLSTDTDYSILN